MYNENLDLASQRNIAKKMLADGNSYYNVMKETHIRLKDLKKMQSEEIHNKF